MTVWSDAALYVWMDEHRGPQHQAIGRMLLEIPQPRRVEVMKVARQLVPFVKRGDWLESVRWTVAAATAGADLNTFRECISGRLWSTRPATSPNVQRPTSGRDTYR